MTLIPLRRSQALALAAVGVGVGLAVGLPLLLLSAQDSGQERYERRRIPENGLVVEELVGGLTDHRSRTIDIRNASVTIPQASGIVWGYGDVPCGYGLWIDLPNGMHVCFDESKQEVEVSSKNQSDSALADAIIASAPEYKIRASVITGELP